MELSNTLCQCWSRNRQRKHSHCRTRNHLWNWVMADGWNRQCMLIHGWCMESTTSKNSRATHKTDRKNRFMCWRMESSNTLCQCWSINRQRKLSHYRTRNHLWKLHHGWRIESTANTNSRLTNEINRENRVIVDAWNRHYKLRHYRPEIISENRVTGDLEISTEVWVTADVWSWERQRTHERHIKPIAKIDSCVTHGIVKHTMLILIHKSSSKTELL